MHLCMPQLVLISHKLETPPHWHHLPYLPWWHHIFINRLFQHKFVSHGTNSPLEAKSSKFVSLSIHSPPYVTNLLPKALMCPRRHKIASRKTSHLTRHRIISHGLNSFFETEICLLQHKNIFKT